MFREIKQTCGPKGKSRSVYEIVFFFAIDLKPIKQTKEKTIYNITFEIDMILICALTSSVQSSRSSRKKY